MPETKKELHYFDKEENFFGQANYKKYHANFQAGPQHRVIGEATPIYMYWNAAPYRIWSYNPQMKWILVLRNPVERAFSAGMPYCLNVNVRGVRSPFTQWQISGKK